MPCHATALRRLERLESRLAPALTVMGPYSLRDLELGRQIGADNWHATTINASGVGLRLDSARLATRMAAAPPEFSNGLLIIAVPRPDGAFERFALWQTVMMESGLAAQFPDIHTYRGQSLDNPSTLLAADFGPGGFHFTVAKPGVTWRIDPTADGQYRSFTATGHSASGRFSGSQETDVPAHGIGTSPDTPLGGGFSLYSSGPTLRTFRLAVAATGEYYNFSGGTIAGTQANIVSVINAANLVLERDFCSRLILVANNTDVIFTDPATDPFTGTDVFAMLNENQGVLDSKIGIPNYDIGHVFSADAFGGGAGYADAINAPWKAGGATKAPTWSTPTGQPFIENVVHELGHQHGALHSLNGINGAATFGRVAWTAVEIGSGSSIMAYPGLCGSDDVQAFADQFFHSISYDQVQQFLSTIPLVGGSINTGNSAPTVSAGPDAVIPANTPFALTASATDPNGDAVTYSWEQRDIGPAQALGSADNGQSPLFRAFAPVTAGTRYFPNLTNLLAGTPSKGEQLPTVNRTLNFRVMARDNKVNGGGVNLDDLQLTVVNTGAAFQVTSPNTATSWPSGSYQTITWNVAGTAAAPINTNTVNILLSTDGGLTWPTALAANTANDGSESVLIPGTATTTARIKIEAVANYFFDVSDVNFAITTAGAMSVTSTTPAGIAASPLTTLDVTFSQPLNAGSIGTDDLTLSQGNVTAANLQSADTARYTINGVAGEGQLTITLPAGAVSSAGSAPNVQFISTIAMDVNTTAFPTPLAAAAPRGSLIFSGSTTGAVNTSSDTDSYTITLDAGQVLSVSASPSSSLRVGVALTGPGGVNLAASGAAAGQSAIIQSASIAQGGVYTLAVSSPNSTTGDYTLRLDLNAAVDVEPNDTTTTAQPLATSAFSLGGPAVRWGTRGQTDALAGLLPNEAEPNDTTGTASDASRSFSPYAGNLYHMGIRSFVGSYYFKLGDIQANDILTTTMSGAASARGVMPDPAVYYYYGPNGFYAGGGDDNAGPGNDALIHRFSSDVFDTFYAGAFGTGNFGDSFQLGFLLENSGAQPLTGGGVTTVTQPNGFNDAADVSTSWRPVQYRSVTAGSTSASDADFVSYQFNAGDLVTFLAHSTSDVELQLELRNSAGTIIASDNGTDSGLVLEDDASIYAYVIPTSGTYFVRVGAAAGSGSYTLTTLLSATTAPPAPTTSPDYFALALTAGQSITIGLQAQGAGAVGIDLVDGGNSVLAAGAGGPTNFTSVVAYTAGAAGTYYLRVTGDSNVDYTLAAASGAALDQEPNDAFAVAQTLSAGRALGAVATGTEDWFEFTANAGEAITLTTTTPGDTSGEFINTFDPIIELFSPSNVLLGTDDNSGGDGRNAKLTRTAAATGSHRARLRGVAASAGEYVLAVTAGTDPPAKIASSVVNSGAAQRSRVTDLTVTFDEVVTLPGTPAQAFRLARTGPGGPAGNATLSVDLTGSTPTQTIAKLSWAGDPTFAQFGSLIDGLYTFTVFAAQVTDSAGQPLDGDADGAPGSDFVFNLHRLYGDNDGDRDVDATDFGAFRQTFGVATNLAFDSDADGDIDANDFGQFRLRFGTSV